MNSSRSAAPLRAQLEYPTAASASPGSRRADLAELQAVHARLEGAYDAMDEIVLSPVPNRQCYTLARFRASRAGLARRVLCQRLIRELLADASAAVAEQIGELQRLDVETLNIIATHVSGWGVERTDSDWPGYCRASRVVGRQLRAQIVAERRVLYPLLRG